MLSYCPFHLCQSLFMLLEGHWISNNCWRPVKGILWLPWSCQNAPSSFLQDSVYVCVVVMVELLLVTFRLKTSIMIIVNIWYSLSHVRNKLDGVLWRWIFYGWMPFLSPTRTCFSKHANIWPCPALLRHVFFFLANRKMNNLICMKVTIVYNHHVMSR